MAAEVIVTDTTRGVGLKTPEPFVREVGVLLSPLLQEGMEDVAVGYTEIPTGGQGSSHHHPDAAEIWLFFQGVGRATIGDQQVATHPGTVIYTPPGTNHQFENTGDESVKLYFMYVPSGAEKAVIDAEFR